MSIGLLLASVLVVAGLAYGAMEIGRAYNETAGLQAGAVAFAALAGGYTIGRLVSIVKARAPKPARRDRGPTP